MLGWLWLPWALFGIVAVLLSISIYYNYKFAMTILRVEDAVEHSLDELEERFQAISAILEMPLFYDSPQIKQVVADISASRDAVLYVANQLTRVELDGEKKEDT